MTAEDVGVEKFFGKAFLAGVDYLGFRCSGGDLLAMVFLYRIAEDDFHIFHLPLLHIHCKWVIMIDGTTTAKEVPLNSKSIFIFKTFQIGTAAVVMMVVLRLSIGCHFLYEGVWKIAHPEFSADGFLTQAKGPAAWIFYAMISDIDGRERLKVADGATGKWYADRWQKLQHKTVRKYRLDDRQATETQEIYQRFADGLVGYLEENSEDIAQYFNSLDRFQAARAAGNNGAAYQKKRTWDRQQELRKEANQWLSAVDEMELAYHNALWSALSEDQRQRGALPVGWTMSDLINFAVTYGLTAIGVCLVLGLATRPAALGGVAFLTFVLLTQPPWPTIYPPAPEVVGHAMLVDKNFIELVALLVVATTAVGRWGGLDYFAENYVIRAYKSLKEKLTIREIE